MIFEIIDANGNVENTIVASQDFVEQNYPGRFREIPEPPPPRKTIITRYEFLKRFTAQERKAINAAAKRDADVEDFKLLLEAAQEINLTNEDTIAGVNQLEASGLLSPGRASEILNN